MTPPEQSSLVERTFQQRVAEWMRVCFTDEIIADKLERADRFIEEAMELAQSTGYSADRAHALVEYVFSRPIGEPFQEVGGVMVTLAALCNPHGIDMDAAAETELARVWTKIDKIQAKQASKPVGSALPMPVERLSQPSDGVTEAMPAGVRRVVHELRLSERVFRDYARQHEDKAEAAADTHERDERTRKAKRNRDRADACKAALDQFAASRPAATSSDRSE